MKIEGAHRTEIIFGTDLLEIGDIVIRDLDSNIGIITNISRKTDKKRLYYILTFHDGSSTIGYEDSEWAIIKRGSIVTIQT